MGTSDSLATVLVVDDHPANLMAFEAVLSPLGYRIVTAQSGAEALKRLAEHDYVLILMDVHMPNLDGYQTMALIRQREQSRDIPVIFVTAVFNQPEHTHRGYALGAIDYISKPFDPEVLRGKVRGLVSLYMRGQRAERERSQEADRIKDLFLGAVGHDLRNPLSAILLGSQVIAREECGPNAAHREHARKIERAGKRMQRIIEDILDLTRSELAGGIPLSLRTTRLAEVCSLVVEELRIAHRDRSLVLDVDGDPTGQWDPGRLGRVVSNLIGNAMEHGRQGPVRVQVADRGTHGVLQVHNAGAPIDPAALPTIFEPFRRADTSANGLGLGLFIVREIVQAHGGTVVVTSTREEGTTFTVSLPKATPVGAGVSPEQPGQAPGSAL